MTTEERFWSKTIVVGDCWLWTAAITPDGYGTFWLNGRMRPAHRVAYEMRVGPIPAGLQIDHVKARGCLNRHCVNPAHLEPVTNQENARRGDAGQARGAQLRGRTHCPRGHEYTEANTGRQGIRRYCRTCRTAGTRRWRATR